MKRKIALSLVVAMVFSWICCGCDDSQKKVTFLEKASRKGF